SPIQHKFTVAAVRVPIAVVPIVVGGVPIAVLDISVYADGTLDVNARGKLNGQVKLESLQKVKFDFECSGHGCDMNSRMIPVPATAMESVKIDGRLTLDRKSTRL